MRLAQMATARQRQRGNTPVRVFAQELGRARLPGENICFNQLKRLTNMAQRQTHFVAIAAGQKIVERVHKRLPGVGANPFRRLCDKR